MLLSSWPWNVLCFSFFLFSYRVQRVYGTNRGEVPIGVSCKWACAGGLVEKLRSHSVDNNVRLERLLVKVHLSREPQWDQHLLYKQKNNHIYTTSHTKQLAELPQELRGNFPQQHSFHSEYPATSPMQTSLPRWATLVTSHLWYPSLSIKKNCYTSEIECWIYISKQTLKLLQNVLCSNECYLWVIWFIYKQ